MVLRNLTGQAGQVGQAIWAQVNGRNVSFVCGFGFEMVIKNMVKKEFTKVISACPKSPLFVISTPSLLSFRAKRGI
jgi:hypothetical protein